MPQTRQTINVIKKQCETCPETLTIRDDVPMTESQAIALGQWLTVLAEIVVLDELTVLDKHFCSTACLRRHIDDKETEYREAESRQLDRMLNNEPKESWEQVQERLRTE